MRNLKSIMPSISLNIVIRKYIQPLLLAQFYERSISEFWIKKFSLVIPNILIKLGPVPEISDMISQVQQLGYFTYSKIIKTQLQSFTATGSLLTLIMKISILPIEVYCRSGIVGSVCIGISEHKVEYLCSICCLFIVGLFYQPICEDCVCMGSNHASCPSLCKWPLRHVSSFTVKQNKALGYIIKSF